jgi:hypothetical protein
MKCAINALGKKTTLDIGSHINAGAQPRPEAGVQRTLEGVGCTLLFGHDL